MPQCIGPLEARRRSLLVISACHLSITLETKTLFIHELKPSLNVNVSSEKLLFYQLLLLMMSRQVNVLLQIIFLSLGSRPLIFRII